MASFGVLWDVDGTLADSGVLGFSSTNEVLRSHGLQEIDETTYHMGTQYTTPRRLAWHATGDPDDPIGEELGKKFDKLYVQLVSRHTAPLFAGVQDLLVNLERQEIILLGALSNACTEYVVTVLKENSVSGLFSAAVGADSVSRPKPHPDGLQMIASSLAVPVRRCVYIGDSPTDGHAAKAAGMFSIGVTWGSHPVESIQANFDVVVSSVEALHAQIQLFLRSCDI